MARRPLEGNPTWRVLAAALAGLAVAGLTRLKPVDSKQGPAAVPPTEPEKTASIPDTKMPEETKLRLEHHLQIERLLLDKLLIGLLLVVAGYGVNVLVEGIKASATQTQYLLDKRLEAAMKIQVALTEVTTPLQEIALDACDEVQERPQFAEAAITALESLRKAINSNSILFDPAYMFDAEGTVAILSGVVEQDCYASCDVREFVEQVSQYMTDESRQQVTAGRDAGFIAPRGKSFKPLAWTPEELQESGTTGYMDKNYSAWRSSQESKAAAKKICRTK